MPSFDTFTQFKDLKIILKLSSGGELNEVSLKLEIKTWVIIALLNSLSIRPRGLFGIGDPSMIPRIINVNGKIGIPLMNEGKNLVDIICFMYEPEKYFEYINNDDKYDYINEKLKQLYFEITEDKWGF